MRNMLFKSSFLGPLTLTVTIGAVLLFLTWHIASSPPPPSAETSPRARFTHGGELVWQLERCVSQLSKRVMWRQLDPLDPTESIADRLASPQQFLAGDRKTVALNTLRLDLRPQT